MHNTRLFPKGRGADSYRLTGIAERCDWAIMTDYANSEVSIRGDVSKQPRTVYLSLRSYFRAISYFYEEILPRINGKFVLVSGSEDLTIPNQIDARWKPFDLSEKRLITRIIEDERLIHWFAENRDEALAKMSTLPVGYTFIDGPSNVVEIESPETRIVDRPLRVLCANRVREGTQWDVRRNLTRLCRERFQQLSTVITEDIPEPTFKRQVRRHPFVLCAQGGGMDPSPKAWFCIANGSIPIITSSVLDDAYSQLPVVIVDAWDDGCLSLEKLHGWVDAYAPHYDNDKLRAMVLHRLSIDYWWDKIIRATY